jgi:tRNA(Ile)-lysidine synthase
MDIAREIIKGVQETITAHGMLDRGDRIIVAVSGGPDSVCLLHILHALRADFSIDLVVAHYDHGLRPGEDEGETRFVRRLARSMNLPFESAGWASSDRHKVSSLEERARDARYAFLEEIRVRRQAQKVALGHNLNDQAETVLMRLLRGSGSAGLAGIPPMRNGTLIRPLLNLKREDIISYLDLRQLSYVTDSSNLQAEFLRNEIRLDWMPRLLKLQPRLLEHLGHLADVLRGENRYMEHQGMEWVRRRAETLTEDEIVVPIRPFLELPAALRNRVIRTILGTVKKDLRRIDRSHIRAVYDLAAGEKPQGRLSLPRGLSVERTYDTLLVTRMPRGKASAFHYALEGPGETYIAEIGRSVTISQLRGRPDRMKNAAPGTAYLNGDRLHFPLILRNIKPGDRFIPLGMSGHMKVKDFFMNLKIPLKERASTPILFHGDKPVWICGLRIDDRFKVTEDTKRILKATFS